MALIKKDKSQDELRKICLEQLEVFLVAETSSFVDVLFETLKNRAYLTSQKPNTTSNNVDEQQQASRSPKTRNVPAPSGSTRRHPQMTASSNKYPPESSRSGSPSQNRQPSPPPRNSSPNRKRRSRSRSLNKGHKRNRSRSPDASGNHSYGKTKRCRDYDEKGYCMRGNLCSYDHGVNPVVLDSSTSVLGSLASTVTAVNSLPAAASQYTLNNQTNEPYNPETSTINSNYQSSMPYRPTVSINENRNGLNTTKNTKNNVYVPRVNQQRQSSPSNDYDSEQQQFGNNNFHKKSNNQPHYKHQNQHQNQQRNQFRPNNKRRPFNSGDSERVTLEVRKIPASLNTISNLNSHFSKFGTITNLKIGFDNDAEAALVEYSSNAEALAAYRSTEAVLNNRFIKVFWHNSSNSNNSHSTNHSAGDKPKDAEGERTDAEKSAGEKKPIRDRLGGIAEKQASITKNAVNNLINSGLINSNTPNQLASLMMGSSAGNKLLGRPAAPASKPVFNPALLKKQYSITPATTSSTSSSTSVSSSAVTIANSIINSTNSENTTTTTSSSSVAKAVSSLTLITKPQPNKEKLMRKLELQKKRQEMLSSSIQQNRLLIDKLEKAKNDAEKQFIRETIDKLTKQIKQLKDDMERETNSIKEETNLQRQSAVC